MSGKVAAKTHGDAGQPHKALVTMNDVIRTQKKVLAAETLSTQQAQDAESRSERDSRLMTICIILTVIGIVGFFVGHIWVARFRYPVQFKSWQTMENTGTKGKFVPNYSFYEVATARDYPPVSYVMTIGIWTNLSRKGALFLLQCLSYFASHKTPLTSLHWCGTSAQTNASSLLGNVGWACAKGTNITDKKQSLVAHWISSKGRNIWYDYFPDPQTDYSGFLSVPCIQDLYMSEDACVNPQDFKAMAHLWALFDGGLCRVAHESTKLDQSSSQLFDYYFQKSSKPRPTCGGAASSGAVSGAMGVLSSSMMLMMVPGIGPGALVVLGTATAAAAGAGAGVGYLSAKDTCESSVAATGEQ